MNNKIKKYGTALYEHRIKVATTVMCLILSIATFMTTVSGANTFKVIYNGEEHDVFSYRSTVDDVLSQSGIEYDENSSVVDTSLFADQGIISIESVCNVTIIEGGKEVKVKGSGLVRDVIKKSGVKFSDNDEIAGANLDEYVKEGMVITVKPSFSVTINADGEKTTVYLAGGTVADALNKAVITADDDDIVSTPLNTPITGNTTVNITRVEYVERTVTEVVKFSTQKEYSSNLNEDVSQLKRKGVNGERVATYEDKYVNGQLTESTLKKSETTKQAVDQIMIVGTKPVLAPVVAGGAKLASNVKTISNFKAPASLELTENNVPTSYRKKIVGTASAYHCGTHTATGRAVQPGYIAVNPNQIPYHTAMWIVSNDGKYVYGYAFAEDTGGFTKWTGSRATLCDLYMPSESMCSQFGRRGVTIYIL